MAIKKNGETKYEFDPTPDDEDKRVVVMIHGHKGVGKTAVAGTFPGDIKALSLDNKTSRGMANSVPDAAERTRVYNVKKHYKLQVLEPPTEAVKAYRYMKEVLENPAYIPQTPDWQLIDALDIVEEICEMKFRAEEGLTAHKAFGNLSLWKKRKVNLRDLFYEAWEHCERGILFCNWTQTKYLTNDDGSTNTKEVAKWIDIVMAETDILLRVEVKREGNPGEDNFELHHLVIVESSKVPDYFKTGEVIDISNNNWEPLLERHRAYWGE